MKYYGELPTVVATGIQCPVKEMMFYQYLPIKLTGLREVYEKRLNPYDEIIDLVIIDFIETFGVSEFNKHYMYLTVKNLYQTKVTFNRAGWHSDGFMSDDINYIWCDKDPTIFNSTEFSLTQDHDLSISQMNMQYDSSKDVTFEKNSILRLDQYNIHKTAPVSSAGMRNFVKISFSKDQYNLEGNSINYQLPESHWPLFPRQSHRNHPAVFGQNENGHN